MCVCVCVLFYTKQDTTIVGDVISTEIRLPFRELNSQLGALAAAAFYTNPAVSLEVQPLHMTCVCVDQ